MSSFRIETPSKGISSYHHYTIWPAFLLLEKRGIQICENFKCGALFLPIINLTSIRRIIIYFLPYRFYKDLFNINIGI
jgi:hypothetical protein